MNHSAVRLLGSKYYADNSFVLLLSGVPQLVSASIRLVFSYESFFFFFFPVKWPILLIRYVITQSCSLIIES